MPLPAHVEPVYRTIYVVIATVLGGGFAGGLLMAFNVQRTGQGGPSAALMWGAVGLLVALVGGAVGHAVSLPYGTLPLLTAAAFAVVQQLRLGRAVQEALDDGAPDGSVVGLGTVSLLGVAQSMAWAAIL